MFGDVLAVRISEIWVASAGILGGRRIRPTIKAWALGLPLNLFKLVPLLFKRVSPKLRIRVLREIKQAELPTTSIKQHLLLSHLRNSKPHLLLYGGHRR